MILSAIAPWFGSKRTLAPEIVKHFGPHDTYYEPFCGSCAVLFAKPPSRLEVASDKHSDVINLLKCLREEKQARAIWEFVERMPVSETMFAEASERMKSPIEDEYYCDQFRAIDFLVVSWQGPSGLAGTKNKPRFAKRNTASGGSTAARWRNVGQSIPAWHERLRNVEFRNMDAFEIIEDIPDREGVLVYIDSPYADGSRKGGEYVFDFEPEQHRQLAAMLQRFQYAQVIVSYYACQEIDELYPTFVRHDLTAARKLNNTAGGETSTVDAGECLYVNRGAESK